MAVVESKLKTGSLLIGTAPGVEYGCQETNVRITPEHNEEGDQTETLCGDVLTPVTTTSWTLNGTAIQDWDSPTGQSIVQYSWAHDGETVPFVWKPNATTTSFTGNVTIRALELGGDINTRLTTDFAWPLAGKPTTVWGTNVPATGATAGTPGSWTPAGATPPASVAALIAASPAIVASPTTAWTTGQYVQTGTAGVGGQGHWNGTAWTSGVAALAADGEEPADDEEPDTTDTGSYGTS